MSKTLKTSWRYIRRSPYQALAAIGMMTLTLFVSAVFVLLAVGSEQVLQYFEKRPQVIAFLNDEAEKEQVDNLSLRLYNTRKVEKVNYVSKEDALKIYQEQNKDDPLLLEMVSAEILPASLEISTTEIGYLEDIATLLSQEEIVEEVSFQKDLVKCLQKVIQGIRQGGVVLTGFLVLESFFIVLLVVGMKASARRREIKIVQLLGADYWYINAPFLLEGAFYGVISALIAWGMAFVALVNLTPTLSVFLSEIPLFPVPITVMLALLAGMILVGVMIGILGSFIAVERYLK